MEKIQRREGKEKNGKRRKKRRKKKRMEKNDGWENYKRERDEIKKEKERKR